MSYFDYTDDDDYDDEERTCFHDLIADIQRLCEEDAETLLRKYTGKFKR